MTELNDDIMKEHWLTSPTFLNILFAIRYAVDEKELLKEIKNLQTFIKGKLK